MQVPLEARSVHGQVFGCWGRDAAETTRTYEFVTQARNLLPELMAGVERLIRAADGVVAGADAVAQTELMAELVAALGALREVREVPVIPDAEVGVAEDLTDRTDRTDF